MTTELNLEQERRDFEKRYAPRVKFITPDEFIVGPDGEYFSQQTYAAWQGWLAAAAANSEKVVVHHGRSDHKNAPGVQSRHDDRRNREWRGGG